MKITCPGCGISLQRPMLFHRRTVVTCYNCGVVVSSSPNQMGGSPPPQLTATGLSELRALEIEVVERIRSDRGGELLVKITSKESDVMSGYVFTASIPGQTRSVTVTAKQLKLPHKDLVEYIVDELKYAIYLLLDEDTEED